MPTRPQYKFIALRIVKTDTMNEIIRCLTRSMKIIGLIACLFVSLSGWIAAQTNPPLDDPLFGIELNPTQVHFEISPPRIGQVCGELRNRVLWIFANTVNEGKSYFILNGYFPTAGSICLKYPNLISGSELYWTERVVR